VDLHLTAEAITRRLSDMSDAELAALEQRMVAVTPISTVIDVTANDDGDDGPDDEVRDSPPSGNDS
jgi:hypothetical protein